MDQPSTTVISAKTLIDGMGGPPLQRPIVVVEDGRITAVGQQGKAQPPQRAGVRELAFPEGHLLPGLIDVHTHLMFGTVGERGYRDGPYEAVIERDTDEIMLLRAAHNTHMHLSAGVTTLRDCGARNRITFDLREGARQGLVTAPRLLLSGRPVTITGGHFFWCNGEADGEDGVRNAVRQLVKEGSDFIKIMASGGGTAITDNRKRSYSVGELRAIVEEAHAHGKLTTAHCLATQSMINALDAGVEMMEHGGFIEPDGSYVFRPEIAERIARQGMYVSPTVQTGYRGREALLERLRSSHLNSAGEAATRSSTSQVRESAGVPGEAVERVGHQDRSRYRRYPDVRRLLPGPGTSEPGRHEQHGGHKVGHKRRGQGHRDGRPDWLRCGGKSRRPDSSGTKTRWKISRLCGR